jgi:DNA polymerase-1
MRALLDGDIYAFRPAAASENDDLGIAIWRMEEMIDNTLAETHADQFSIFLSGGKNFRHDIYPEYKAQRPKEKPRHLADLKQYLVDKYKAVVADGCEADDLLGIEQCAGLMLRGDLPGRAHNDVNPLAPETIICSLDKDLKMIPGNHYSFQIEGTSSKGARWVRPAEITKVAHLDGLRHFYTQCLTGDPADNVKGAKGVGKVKAESLLRGVRDEEDLFSITRAQFSCDEEFLMTAQVIWIWRKPNDIWQFPTGSS